MMIEISLEQYNKMAERLTELEYELAESVKVVRCKDCIHYENDESVCRIDDMIVDDTDYCSYGEKSNKTSIDVDQLSFGTPITMTESLTDMSPMEWSKDVLNGEKKVEVKADNKDCAVGEKE